MTGGAVSAGFAAEYGVVLDKLYTVVGVDLDFTAIDPQVEVAVAAHDVAVGHKLQYIYVAGDYGESGKNARRNVAGGGKSDNLGLEQVVGLAVHDPEFFAASVQAVGVAGSYSQGRPKCRPGQVGVYLLDVGGMQIRPGGGVGGIVEWASRSAPSEVLCPGAF